MSNEIPRYFYANRQEYHSFTDMYLYLDKPLWTEGTTNQEDSPTQSEIHIYGEFLVDEIVVAALTNSEQLQTLRIQIVHGASLNCH